MVYNQLFVDKPNIEIVNKIIKAFGLNDINDGREFSFLDMNRINTIIQLRIIEEEIKDCYLPCKQRKYFNQITNKTSITMFRQFLKTQDYDLVSRERFINSKKCLVYKIITKEEKNKDKKPKMPENVTVYFD